MSIHIKTAPLELNKVRNTEPKIFRPKDQFALESGEFLTEISIVYHTFGKLNHNRSNVVWVCHALTANANPLEWWPGLVGENNLINPEEHFIVCANVIGSCYGTTGPKNFNPLTGDRYLRNFPKLTIKDIVKAHRLLQGHLGIQEIFLGLGGSMGGQQLIEWAVQLPSLFENLALIASSAKSSPWGIAIRTAQRMAIEADPSFYSSSPKGGWKGLEAARAMAMVSYRTHEIYNRSQAQPVNDLGDSRVEGYQRYQGEKLRNRFDARTYFTLSKAMDTHDVSRNRGSVAKVLATIQARALIIGINEDLLFTADEQVTLAENIKYSELNFINSRYGHDGFLTEAKTISTLLQNFLNKHS